ncbi:MAG: TIGR00730 family Rossman fold protein [Salibacteraceae bacterium]
MSSQEFKPQSICVFCASSVGTTDVYIKAAKNTGKMLAKLNIRTIYGGGKVGLMGALADGAIEKNGKVTGIIPSFMTPHEIAHQGISELIVVESMHERKMLMHEQSDAVITLPGGFGTFEELFEILTWIQLGLFKKPVGILNVNGYYDHLEKQLDHMADEGLLRKEHRPLIFFSDNLDSIMNHFKNFKPSRSIFELLKDQT